MRRMAQTCNILHSTDFKNINVFNNGLNRNVDKCFGTNVHVSDTNNDKDNNGDIECSSW